MCQTWHRRLPRCAAYLWRSSSRWRMTESAPFSSSTSSLVADLQQMCSQVTPVATVATTTTTTTTAAAAAAAATDRSPRLQSLFTTDWLGLHHSTPLAIIEPLHVEEISRILAYCNRQGIAVTPQGGNTGLVGGSVPATTTAAPNIILSTRRMNNLHRIDPRGRMLFADAGCTLHQLQVAALERENLVVPIDMASASQCTIGGNIACNAGGVRFIRYGSLHANCLGLEVVLADGSVLDLNYTSALRKDAVGYGLRNLFIGSEGTLGVVTRVCLQLFPNPISYNHNDNNNNSNNTEKVSTILIRGVRSIRQIAAIYEQLVVRRSALVYAFEMFENAVLIECDTSDLGDAFESPWIDSKQELELNVQIAQNESQRQSFWKLREEVPLNAKALALKMALPLNKFDVSLSAEQYAPFLQRIDEYLAAQSSATGRTMIPIVWGHFADGNLHVNVVGEMTHAETEAIYDLVTSPAFNGSISAEHGIGVLKREYLRKWKPAAWMRAMQSIKQALDPKNIMNPGVLLVG